MEKLTDLQRDTYCARLKLIINNLRFCNSGADVHLVNTMRHCATLMYDLVCTAEHLDANEAERIIRNIEKACVEYFIKKFGN